MITMEGTPQYQYHVKDHLGNNRLTINSGGVIVDQAAYYPFGMLMTGKYSSCINNKYLYNGKELQDDELAGVNLDWNDYGARFYDAALARWFVVDPLAEKYFEESTYIYAGNNPMIYIDPDGQVKIKVQGHFKWTSGIAGGGIKALGYKKSFEGAKEQELSINLTFDTKTKELTIGAALLDREKKGDEVTGGLIYGGGKTTEKETGNEAKFGYNFEEKEVVAEVEPIEDGEMKEVEEGTLGIGTVTQKEGEGTKVSVGVNPEVNFGIVGTGVGINISIQDEEE